MRFGTESEVRAALWTVLKRVRMTATAVPSDAEANATAEAMLELWRVAPEVAAEVIDDADDTARWPSAAPVRSSN